MSVAERATTLPTSPRAIPRASLRSIGAILSVAAICTIPIALFAPFFTEPFMRDEGLYAAVAQIMKHGGMPYQDAFDNKPPLIFGWYYLSFALFGEHVWAPRLLVALLLSGATFLMYVEGRLLFSHRYGLATAFAFAMSFGLATLQTSANTEYFMLPPLVAALVAFTLGKQRGGWQWYALAGFMSGAAIATKDISLFAYILFLALAAWPLLRMHGLRAVPSRDFARSVGGLIGGCFAALVLVVAPFVATGILPDMWEATVVYTLKYVGGVPLSTKLDMLLNTPTFLVVVLGPWFVFTVLGLIQARTEGARGYGPLLTGWLAANFLGIVAAGRFYNHYFITLLPALSLIAPLGLVYLDKHWRVMLKPRGIVLALTMLVVLPFLTMVQISHNVEIFGKATPEERHIAKYPADDRAPWENQGPELAAWLDARTAPDDPVYNFGFQSELYFYADRRSPTRFLMDRPFWYSDSYIDQALEELNADMPVYVVDSAVYENWSEGKVYTQEIKDWVVANYDYVGKIEYADIWRLKAGAGRGTEE